MQFHGQLVYFCGLTARRDDLCAVVLVDVVPLNQFPVD